MRVLALTEEKGTKKFREGHRERLRARYGQAGEAALQDYELPELLLVSATSRRDTKLLGKRVLERLRTLARGLGIRTA